MRGSGGVTGAGGTGPVASGGVATGGITSRGTGGGSAALGGSLGTGGTIPTGGTSAVGGSGGSPGGVLLVATYDGQVHATWQNQTSQSIFLYGCGTVEWSQLEGADWVNHGAFVVCGWEGVAVEVAAGATYTETQSFARAEAGRYRLSGRYGVGCTPGLGLSNAGCTAFFTATSNEFVVSATGGTGGAGAGGVVGTGGTSAGGTNGTALTGVGGHSSGGVGGNATGGSGGGGTGGLACPPDLPPGPPWQFCVGVALYEGTAECYDGGACTCVPGKHVNCLEGCVKNPNDAGGSCRSGLIECPSIDHYKPVCFANALNELATACPAGGTCTCILMLREQCANRCVDHPDGSGECD